MNWTLRKWKAVFSIYFQDGIAYRASGLIWVTIDLATAVTMPLVWARASHSGPIGGFTTSDFILYYLCMLFLGSFITSHIMWELAMEIKEGFMAATSMKRAGNLTEPWTRAMVTSPPSSGWRSISST